MNSNRKSKPIIDDVKAAAHSKGYYQGLFTGMYVGAIITTAIIVVVLYSN